MHKTQTKHGNDGDPLFLIGWSADVLSISCFCKYVLCVWFVYVRALIINSVTPYEILSAYHLHGNLAIPFGCTL